MYTLYIANKNYSSWSLRPWLLMTELGIAFEERFVPFLEGSSYEAFRRFSPSGMVPCLVDGDRTVWESLAIVEYLAEGHDGVWPTNDRARAFARSASAEMHAGFSTLRAVCTMTVGQRIQLHEKSPALRKDLARIDELWSEGLAGFGGPFLAGHDFTAVDAFFAPVAFRLQTYGISLSAAANNYAQRLLKLEGMQQWYRAALAETLREASHEAEIERIGTVLEDLRAAPAP